MTKVLVFDDSETAKDRYHFLYQGLCQSTKTANARDLKMLKVEGSACKKLEAIGIYETKPTSRFHWVPRVLAGPAVVEMDADEIKMLVEYVPAAQWSVMAAAFVADAVEWVSVAPDKDVYDKAQAKLLTASIMVTAAPETTG